MRKGKSIIGLRVVSQSEGEALGVVRDLIFDQEASQLLALLLSEKDLFGLIDAQIVPWDKIRNIGADAVIVESNDSRIKAGDHKRVNEIMNQDGVLSGTQVLTSQGRSLGSFADLYIDEESGTVVGYEISGGFVSDTLSGKQFLPAPREMSMGSQVAIVPPVETEPLSPHQANLKDGLRSVADKMSAAYSSLANASVEKQKEYVVGKVASRTITLPGTEAADSPGNEEILVVQGETISREQAEIAAGKGILGALLMAAVGGVAGEYTKEARSHASHTVIGARASQEVIAPDGTVIVEQGEIITEMTVEKARLFEREEDLIAAGGVGAAHDGAAQVTQQATGLWNAVRNKVNELGASVHDKLIDRDTQGERDRIDHVLGCPVDRVILDRQDNIILKPGEMITNAAVARAREAGMLEILLGAAVAPASAAGSQPAIVPPSPAHNGVHEKTPEAEPEPQPVLRS